MGGGTKRFSIKFGGVLVSEARSRRVGETTQSDPMHVRAKRSHIDPVESVLGVAGSRKTENEPRILNRWREIRARAVQLRKVFVHTKTDYVLRLRSCLTSA